ncbi:OmpP1/FadL family transporter [Rubrimonas cliftonensis]|nr:outer membrane protein transport protein [Rubrimonas cliftonensis]
MVIALSAGAHAGGFERSDQSVAVLFKEGRYLEFAVRAGFPEVDGVATATSPTPGVESGNIAENFVDFYAAFKFDINERFSAAIVYDEPFATDIAYPTSGYFLSGANAELKIRELAGVLQYNLPSSMAVFGGGLSVYGGPRLSYTIANAEIPTSNGYSIDTDNQFGFGFLGGVAWERPELGMRVALTYNSEIKNDLDSTETLANGTVVNGETALDTPQSLTLEFQTGLNPKTLLFGSVRWVEWGDFTIKPPLFSSAAGNPPLAFFPDDTITYRLGLGRRLTEDFSIFGDVSYEPESGGQTGNLTPRDGFLSFGVGGTYDFEKVSVTLGARYALLGDADTVPAPGGPNVAQFRDNSAFFVGARLGFDLN